MFFTLRAMYLGHKVATLQEKLANTQNSHKERMRLLTELKLAEYKMEDLFAL